MKRSGAATIESTRKDTIESDEYYLVHIMEVAHTTKLISGVGCTAPVPLLRSNDKEPLLAKEPARSLGGHGRLDCGRGRER